MLYLISTKNSDILPFISNNFYYTKYELKNLEETNNDIEKIITEIESLPVDRIVVDFINQYDKIEKVKEFLLKFIKKISENYIIKINKPKIYVLSTFKEIKEEIIEFTLPHFYVHFQENFENIIKKESIVENYVLYKKQLEYFIYRNLPPLKEDEAFYYILLFRRKWLIKQKPENEELFRKIFNSDEMKIDSGILKGNRHNFVGELFKSIYNLACNKEKYKFLKGKYFNVNKLFLMYPNTFSLLITFEPRNIKRGLKKYCFEMLNNIIENKNKNSIIHCDKELQSFIHSSRRIEGKKYVLIDIDFDSKLFEEHKLNSINEKEQFIKNIREKYINNLKEYLNETDILNNLEYACSTPSFGMHLIFSIDEKVGNVIFKRREFFTKELIALGFSTKYTIKEVEVKTGQCLTHIPTIINPLVENLTLKFKKEI